MTKYYITLISILFLYQSNVISMNQKRKGSPAAVNYRAKKPKLNAHTQKTRLFDQLKIQTNAPFALSRIATLEQTINLLQKNKDEIQRLRHENTLLKIEKKKSDQNIVATRLNMANLKSHNKHLRKEVANLTRSRQEDRYKIFSTLYDDSNSFLP